MRFSQRIGKRPVKTLLQVDTIDEDLRNRLWNIYLEHFIGKISNYGRHGGESELGHICKYIWREHFNFPVDKIPSFNDGTVSTAGFIAQVRKWFFAADWFEVYDFIEVIAFIDNNIVKVGFTKECNWGLEKEVSGYRIVDDRVVQITSEEEIQEVEDSLINSEKWKSVGTHLKTALDTLSDRKNPNYRTSIKESISAVEALCKIIAKDEKATLGKALSEIEKTHKIHAALKTAFSALYGYASNSGGIRHALLESDIEPKFEDAKFMLVCCSAFINYLKTHIKI